MNPSDTGFPARHLFTATARGLGDHGLAFDGPLGRRSVSRCSGGDFGGDRVTGTIVANLSNEWRIGATDVSELVEGLVTLTNGDGATVLMTYRGRRSARYGADAYRVGVTLEADGEAVDWLNDVHAVAYVHVRDTDLRFEVFELLGRPAEDGVLLEVEPLYSMHGRGTVGERYKVRGQVSDRYLTMAEEGCATEGAIAGTWLEGFSWGPHRMARTDRSSEWRLEESFPWHIDMRVAMRTGDGVPVIQHYLGSNSREMFSGEADADRSWRTSAVFETATGGPLSWLNEIVAVGVGWQESREANYLYYTLI
jgi:hypothetical protein